jgi:hypothetical protein
LNASNQLGFEDDLQYFTRHTPHRGQNIYRTSPINLESSPKEFFQRTQQKPVLQTCAVAIGQSRLDPPSKCVSHVLVSIALQATMKYGTSNAYWPLICQCVRKPTQRYSSLPLRYCPRLPRTKESRGVLHNLLVYRELEQPIEIHDVS